MSSYFNLPFDPTGFTTISGAQLAQLVGGLGPATGYGFCIVSVDDAFGNPNVPNPGVTPSLSSFLWLRIGNVSNSSATLYIWNPNGATSASVLKWQIANISSITAGSITGSQIASNTITDNNIASVGWGKLPSGGAVGGCLVGSMPNPGLANLAVGTGNLALNSVGGPQMVFGSPYQVYMTNSGGNAISLITDYFAALSSTGLGLPYQIPQVNSGGNAIVWITDFFSRLIGISGLGTSTQTARVNVAGTALEWITDFFSSLAAVGLGTAHQVPQVNSGATGLQWATINSSPFGTLVSISDPNNAGLPTSGAANRTSIPHTLGARPTYLRVVVVNLSTEAGYSVGDEVELVSFTGTNGTFRVCPFSVASDATNVVVGINGITDSTNMSVLTKNADSYTNLTQAKWQLKIYAAL